MPTVHDSTWPAFPFQNKNTMQNIERPNARTPARILAVLATLCLCVLSQVVTPVGTGQAAEPKAASTHPTERRPEWTTSRIAGTPEPPPPYRVVRAFPKLQFSAPTVVASAPGMSRLFVAQRDGNIVSFPLQDTVETSDTMLSLKDIVVKRDLDREFDSFYGLTFHPQFANNRYCYVCYVVNRKGDGPTLEDGTRVSRFTVSTLDPPRCDPDSEQLIITWRAGGHNGGCIEFGPDGCLYISTGDGSSVFPPDSLNAGQDVSNLLSSILRIDVDHVEPGKPYSIPRDNPLVNTPGARGEIWAYGLRNPWKMTFDRQTGDLWVGDVGWELWETLNRVRPGDNYGWSIVEASQSVHPDGKRGPTPIVPPTVAIPHTEGASITAGYAYRGSQYPDLRGTYIFGDFETRRIWGMAVDGAQLGPRYDLANASVRLSAFGQDQDGELYLADYDQGTLHRLVPNDEKPRAQRFPERLSESGLFADVATQRVAAGVVPFSINVPQWADFATSEWLIGVPGSASIKVHDQPYTVPGTQYQRTMDFPADTVFAKTLSLEMERGNPSTQRRVETQVLHYDGVLWRGYAYEWNDEQTDAHLVAATGKEREFSVKDATSEGGIRKQTWRFVGRQECIRCHNPWAESTLAFTIPQLNRPALRETGGMNQISLFRLMGLLESDESSPAPATLPVFADPRDSSDSVQLRARSYLHANCAHCHRFAAGGAARLYLNYEVANHQTEAIGLRPSQGTFGMAHPLIIAPGDPYRSALFYRISTEGPGRMPHIGSRIVDVHGVALIADWIRQLPSDLQESTWIQELAKLDEEPFHSTEAAARPAALEERSRSLATAQGRDQPNDEDVRQAQQALDREAAEQSADRARSRDRLIHQLLATSERALRLAQAIRQGQLPPSVRTQAVMLGVTSPEEPIRNLFESFVPEERRVQRLGDQVHADQIMPLVGDAQRGKQLWASQSLQCKNCHRIGQEGGELGPALADVGKRLNRVQLIESLLEPSKTVDPKFRSWLVRMEDGRQETGLLIEQTDSTIVLRNTKHEIIRLNAEEAELSPQATSLMPDRQLSSLTAQQAADLLAYLESLK